MASKECHIDTEQEIFFIHVCGLKPLRAGINRRPYRATGEPLSKKQCRGLSLPIKGWVEPDLLCWVVWEGKL